MKQVKSILSISSALLLALTIWSCKKTEYVAYEKESLNRILEYKVTNSQQQQLLGAIDNVANTITLYIPYYLGIDHIVSDVTLDEGATIFDANGTELDLDGGSGLEPVAVGDSVVQYTVKSADGISRTYALIQKVLPYSETLWATYDDYRPEDEMRHSTIASRIYLKGNFESTSKNAKFIFTDRQTGVKHENFFTVHDLTPGNPQYNMTVDISPDAVAGEYDVSVEHQGRTADIAPITLRYQRPYHGFFSSSSSYAPGDTIVFNALQFFSEQYDGVFIGIERAYLKLQKEMLYVTPEGFPDSLNNKEIELQIVSKTRSQVKAIFPQIPVGQYGNSYVFGTNYVVDSGFGFWFDFNNETDFGKAVLVATSASRFTVK